MFVVLPIDDFEYLLKNQKDINNLSPLDNLFEKINTNRQNIINLANNYGAFNLEIIIEGKELIFLVDLQENKSLFDMGGLSIDLEDLLKEKVIVFTRKMFKKQTQDFQQEKILKL